MEFRFRNSNCIIDSMIRIVFFKPCLVFCFFQIPSNIMFSALFRINKIKWLFCCSLFFWFFNFCLNFWGFSHFFCNFFFYSFFFFCRFGCSFNFFFIWRNQNIAFISFSHSNSNLSWRMFYSS